MTIRITTLLLVLFLAACATPEGAPEPVPDAGVEVLRGQAREAYDLRELDTAQELYLELMRISDDPDAARQAARVASMLRDWTAALDAAGRWRELEPDSRPAAQLEVVALMHMGDVDSAVRRFREEMMPTPDDVGAWRTAVALFSSAESRLAADTALDRLLLATGPHPAGFGLLQRSRMASQFGELGQARVLAESALDARADYAAAMWLARLARETIEYEQALDALDRALEQRPDDRDALMAKSEVLRDLGRFDEALEVLVRLPQDVETLYIAGALRNELGRPAEAEATWRRLAEFESPPEANRHAWLTGLLAEVLGLEREASEWYGKVRGEHTGEARLRNAVVVSRMGDLERARDLLAPLRRSAVDTAEQAWLVEAQLLIDAGREDEALELYNEALARIPGSLELLYSRGMLAVNLDRLELAEQDLRTIIQRDPNNAFALNALGYTLSDRTDRQREALSLIERALALAPNNGAILDSMGWVLYKLDRPAEALDYLRRAVDAEPHPEIVAHLIEVLWVLDQRAEARSLVERYREVSAGDKVFEETLRRLGL